MTINKSIGTRPNSNKTQRHHSADNTTHPARFINIFFFPLSLSLYVIYQFLAFLTTSPGRINLFLQVLNITRRANNNVLKLMVIYIIGRVGVKELWERDLGERGNTVPETDGRCPRTFDGPYSVSRRIEVWF